MRFIKKYRRVMTLIVCFVILTVFFAGIIGEKKYAKAVSGLSMSENATDSITLKWAADEAENICYYIYLYDAENGTYSFYGDTREPYFVCSNLKPATKYHFSVKVLNETDGTSGELCAPVEVWTRPEQVKELEIVQNKVKRIKIKWSAMEGADGYTIYRALEGEDYILAGTSVENVYTDMGVKGGRTYSYKVCAYTGVQQNEGAASDVAEMTTLPAKPAVKVKGGENQARITWAAIYGAAGYYVYCYDGEQYQLLTTLEGKSNTSYLHRELENGTIVKYRVEAFRIYKEKEYKSNISEESEALVDVQKETVSVPALFKTKADFLDSDAYKECAVLQKYGKYGKNYVIPGMTGTNTDGFYSTTMCPQGITFAGSYFLLSAYDRAYEENSVIYVMDKSTKKLLLTVTLPNQTHAGGITYDGYNVWVTQAKKIHAIPLSDFKKAIAKGKKTYSASFKVTCVLPERASTLTYYKGMIWGASYDELEPGYITAYKIKNKKGTPSLTNCLLTEAVTKIQGLAFSDGGKLILSRSCQTDPEKRGFEHVLDVYKPNLSKLEKGKMTLGKIKKTIEMPTMNEELAISGNYLYVNFESVAFTEALQRTDRVCALKLKGLID